MKVIKYFLLTFLVILLTSCQSTGSDEQMIKINYHFNNDENNSSEVIDFKTLELNPPVREGYTFSGWYLDNDIWEVPVSKISDLIKEKITEFNIYARWKIITYEIKLNGMSESEQYISVKYDKPIPELPTPTKEGFLFLGWFLDSQLTQPFNLTRMPSTDLVLYPKWDNLSATEPLEPTLTQPSGSYVTQPSELPTEAQALNTEILYILGFYYGNSNGNLANEGLATFSNNDEHHYYIQQSNIYSFNPATNKTNLVYEKTTGVTPAFLNIYNNKLFFINKDNGHVLAYDMDENTTTTISDKDNHYLRVDNYYIYTLYNDVINGVLKPVYNCYRLRDYSLIREDLSGFEQINVISNRVLFKYHHNLTLNLMNYNGQGKFGLGNFNETNVDTILESLVYQENNNHYYYVLSLEVNNLKGLYLYNSDTKTLDLIEEGAFHSLNFNDKSIFAIKGNTIYEFAIDNLNSIKHYDIPVGSRYIQVINNWLYIANINNDDLIRINPATKNIENENDILD